MRESEDYFHVNGKTFHWLHAFVSAEFIHVNFSFIARILLFYLIFYAALAGFFMAMWFIFASSLLKERPKYELKESIIGTNPGLGFRPNPPESNVESTLIWYQKKNPKNSEYWVEEIERFLSGKHIALLIELNWLLLYFAFRIRTKG